MTPLEMRRRLLMGRVRLGKDAENRHARADQRPAIFRPWAIQCMDRSGEMDTFRHWSILCIELGKTALSKQKRNWERVTGRLGKCRESWEPSSSAHLCLSAQSAERRCFRRP